MPPLPPDADEDGMGGFLAESSRLMAVTEAYLTHTVQDGQQAVDTLATLFSDIHGRLRPPLPEGTEARLRAAIVQLQFYDRLSQRVGHVQETLAAYRQLLAQPGEARSAARWRSLWQEMAARCPHAEDRWLLTGTDPVDDPPGVAAGRDDVELF